MPTRQAEHIRRIRAERVAAGLCRDCGADAGGHYRCPPCAKRSAAYSKAWLARNPRTPKQQRATS